MAIHPDAAAIEQDRPAIPWAGRPVDRPAYGRWQWDQDHLGAFTAHSQHPITVLLAYVGDVGSGGFEDPQAEQSEHGYQREVARVWGVAGGSEQGLGLQVSEPRVGDSGGTAGRRTCSAGE